MGDLGLVFLPPPAGRFRMVARAPAARPDCTLNPTELPADLQTSKVIYLAVRLRESARRISAARRLSMGGKPVKKSSLETSKCCARSPATATVHGLFPRSILLTVCQCKPTSSATHSCVSPALSRAARIFAPMMRSSWDSDTPDRLRRHFKC